MTQKELKEMYMNIIKTEVWEDEYMQNFAKKNCAYVVQFSNGDIADIEKPSIKKDFCFGAGSYGNCTDEELTAAENMSELARKSEQYFKEQNLKKVDSKIESLEKCLNDCNYECYTYTHYMGQPDNSKLKGFKVVKLSYNPEFTPGLWSACKDVKKLEANDIQKIIDGFKEVRKAFEKRIDTYLKRYGTTKVNSWSYIRD